MSVAPSQTDAERDGEGEREREREADIVDTHPLTPAQLGLFYDIASEPEEPLFVERVVCPIRGPLDHALFADVWQAVVARHDSLRSGFVFDDRDTPMQVVHRAATLPVTIADWTPFDPPERARRLDEALAWEAARGFALERPPLMRVTLMRLGEEEHMLLWCSHHLIIDGWSCWIVLCEVALRYLAAKQGAPLTFPPAPSFSAYVRWLAREDGAEAHRRFWREYLRGVEPSPMPAMSAGPRRFAQHRALLPVEVTREITTFARTHRIALHTLLEAAWALVIAERQGTEADDVLFGSVFSGRGAGFPGAEDLVGMLISALPVRVPLPADMTAGAWLELLQRRHAEMLAHECCSTHQAQRWAGVERRGPLFDSVLVLMNVNPLERLPPLELEIGPPRYLANASYPLGVNVTPGHQLIVEMWYDSRYFTEPAVDGLQAMFAAALVRLARFADLPLGAVREAVREARREHAASRRRIAMDRLEHRS